MNSKALILFLGFLFAVGLAISSATETQDEKQVDGLEGKSQIDDELQGTEAMPEKADTTDIANHHGGHGGHGGSGGGGKGSGGSGGSGGGKGGSGTGGGSGGGGSGGGGKGGSSLPQKKPKTKFRNQSISL